MGRPRPSLSKIHRPVRLDSLVTQAIEVASGERHRRRSLEGTFLGGCVFSGRLAARAIADKR